MTQAMIELTPAEVQQVCGGGSLGQVAIVAGVLNALSDFASGFVDGVNAASAANAGANAPPPPPKTSNIKK